MTFRKIDCHKCKSFKDCKNAKARKYYVCSEYGIKAILRSESKCH